ncbi:Nitrate reductase [Abortiporus biennis]
MVEFPQPFIPPSLQEPGRECPALPLASLPKLPINDTPTVIVDLDAQTPDNWVKRNPDFVRLTGKHPFNVEAPLTPVFNAGFLTPAHLHFVRNHGAVPRVDETKLRNWRIRVHGLLERECSFSIQDLKDKFQVVTLPVTLVCAGNRRKEQNVVRKSLGFNWGAGGVSTALWTGVYLADILEYVKPFYKEAKHVIFEGDDELPNGPYGTSQRSSVAREKRNGILIAWAMNGLPLEPDHGFPVRLIVPGQIGGRMVKWLRRVELSAKESQHYLHFFDNRVLPMQLSPEQARAEKEWWYDPRYMINELNVNSAIVKPAHQEVLEIHSHPLNQTTSPREATYTLRGYAYSGGGRRVTRVEISLDDGVCWKLADIDYPEDLYRSVYHEDPVYGLLDLTERDTCFCWCFWKFDVSVKDLAESTVIAVRAMDEGLSIQPRDMYLNATSMMNNWWFRVAILRTETKSGVKLKFEHPTIPGVKPGGWMERLKTSGQDIMQPDFEPIATDTVERQPVPPPSAILMTKSDANRLITVDELQKHDKSTPWFVIQGEVYDGTGYLDEHPGGTDSILLVAGDDATEDFIAIHSDDAKMKLAKFHVGTLVGKVDDLKSLRPDSNSTSDTASLTSSVLLHPKIWKTIKLKTTQPINHDTYLFRFSFSEANTPLGLPVGKHVFVRLKRKDTGEIVQRAYTPVSKPDTSGEIDFLIKLYLPSSHNPIGGKMTTGFHQLEVGDCIEVKGPLGSFEWKGNGIALWRNVVHKVQHLAMICGGSGITPILQVLRSVFDDDHDRITKIFLIYANKTEEDILCKEELDSLFKIHGLGEHPRFNLHYILSTLPVPLGWTHSSGRVTEDLFRAHFPTPADDCLVLACGPDAMIANAVKPGLVKCGWNVEKSLVVF